MKNSRSAFVLGGAFQHDVIDMFKNHGYDRAKSPDDSDVIVFVGGTDINPKLYGEKPLQTTQYPDDNRDALEQKLYMAFKTKKPMIGICRGAQLLNVLNGGKLWQHVNLHQTSHAAYDIHTKRSIMVSSMHHQMMIPGPTADVFLFANQSTIFKKDGSTLSDYDKKTTSWTDIEGVFYPDTKSLLFQSHPEVGPAEHEHYFFEKIHDKLGV